MVTRVHGGIITDQMLTGSLRYFHFAKTGIGADAIGDGNAQAVSATVAEGGSGYVAGEILTATPGTGTDPQFTILTVGPGGEVLSVGLLVAGSTAQPLPANPQATTRNVGVGTGATLNVVYKSLIQVPDSGGFFVGVNEPVPNSIADQVFEIVAERANIVQIALIDDDNIQIAVENTTWGWVTIDGSPTPVDPDTDLVDRLAIAGPAADGVLTGVPDGTASGTTYDLATTPPAITERFFSSGIAP